MAVDGRVPPAGQPPEREIVRRRERAVRGTMLKAGAAIAFATLAALALRKL